MDKQTLGQVQLDSAKPEMAAERIRDLDDLRLWLIEHGFRVQKNAWRKPSNSCDWYACRRSGLQARSCECNNDKPGMQIVVYPHEFEFNDRVHQSVEIELCGEAGGVWWKMLAYSLKPEELPIKLEGIELSLIAAWNSLVTDKNG